MKKKWLSLLLALTLAVGLLIIPAQADGNEIAGSGALAGKTATFTVKADTPTFLTNGEAYVTFHIYVKSNDTYPIRAFSFVLAPSGGLTLATKVKNDDSTFYYDHPNLETLKRPTMNDETSTAIYASDYGYNKTSKYFGAGGSEPGKGITTEMEVLTIVGKVTAAGSYSLNVTDMVAGDGDAPAGVSQQFRRVAVPAEVTVKGGGAISGVVKNDQGAAQSGAKVTLWSGSTQVGSEVTTGTDGAYSFPAVENGTYTVKAANSGGTLNGSVSVTINSKNVTGNEVTIRAGVSVSGQVKSYDPKHETTVQLKQSGAVKYTATIPAEQSGSGQATQSFSIPGVAAGTYDLVVTKSCHLTYTITGVVVEGADLDLTKSTNNNVKLMTMLVGDVNEDGSITEDDVTVVRYTTNINKTLANAANKTADVNGDGSVTEDDVTVIRYTTHINKSSAASTFAYAG